MMPLAPSALAQAPAAKGAAAPLAGSDVVKAMTAVERTSLQSDLAWSGHYNGLINGEPNDRMVTAISAFQKSIGSKPTGILNQQERAALAEVAKKLQQNVGWTVTTDPATGIRLGLPLKRTPRKMAEAGLTIWNAPQDTIQIRLANTRENSPVTTAMLAEREKTQPANRKVTYATVKPDFFIVTGMQGLKKFYVRGHVKGDQVRILTILYDQATEGTMDTVVIAMSSAFNPFPAEAPQKRLVDYGTGIVVSSDGAVLTDLQTASGCTSIVVPQFGNAEKIAEDKASDLALLRIYGARDLKIAAIGGSGKPVVDVVGIADPQLQNGGAAVTQVKAQLSGQGNDAALSPAPALGFSGGAARDADGAFAGMVVLKPAANQAKVIGSDAVHRFLSRSAIVPGNPAPLAKDAILRIICLRK